MFLSCSSDIIIQLLQGGRDRVSMIEDLVLFVDDISAWPEFVLKSPIVLWSSSCYQTFLFNCNAHSYPVSLEGII